MFGKAVTLLPFLFLTTRTTTINLNSLVDDYITFIKKNDYDNFVSVAMAQIVVSGGYLEYKDVEFMDVKVLTSTPIQRYGDFSHISSLKGDINNTITLKGEFFFKLVNFQVGEMLTQHDNITNIIISAGNIYIPVSIEIIATGENNCTAILKRQINFKGPAILQDTSSPFDKLYITTFFNDYYIKGMNKHFEDIELSELSCNPITIMQDILTASMVQSGNY